VKEESLPYYNDPYFSPLWKGETKFKSDTLHTVASFAFTDQEGEVVNNSTVQGKIYVANFFFTACPSICPKMTLNLGKVQDTFKGIEDVMVISHSVMPWSDSTSQLHEFANLHSVLHPQWRLVTGQKGEIYELARRSYFAEEVAGYKRDSTEFVHTEHCLLVDREGHLRGIYNGTLELEIDRMIDDIRILLEVPN
jgi:protein SCO1/2